MARRLAALALVLLLWPLSLYGQGPLTDAPNLRVRTDSNGYLILSSGVYGGTDGPLTLFGNVRVRTDSNGYLLVSYGSGNALTVSAVYGTTSLILGVNGVTGTWTFGTDGSFLAAAPTYQLGWVSSTKLTGPANGQFNITNSAASAGAGVDVTTDGVAAFRTRAQNADGGVRAAFHNSSASSVLSVSSNTITPTGTIHHVGAGLIKTITVPALCTPTCFIMIVPDAAYTYDATGNVVVPGGGGTATINRMMTFVWDGTVWTPSY